MLEKFRPLVVVLVANVFDGADYSYQSGDLGALKQHVDNGVIGKLIVGDAVVKACKQHLKESADLLAENFRKLFDTHPWRLAEGIGKLSDVPSMIDRGKIEEGMLKNFEQYLTDVHAEIVDMDGATLEETFAHHFNAADFVGKKSKSGEDDRKKSELSAAKASAKTDRSSNGYDEIFIVSGDEDRSGAFGHYKTKIFHSLKELFDKLAPLSGGPMQVMKYFKDMQAELNSDIEDVLWTKPVTVEGLTGEGEESDDFEILNMVVHSAVRSIEQRSEKEFVASLGVRAEIEVECPDFGDDGPISELEKEDEPYRGYSIEHHEISFLTEMVCEIKDRQIKRRSIKPLLPRRLVLDEKSLVDRCALKAADASRFYEHLACKCGHYITINLIDHREEIGVMAERGMGLESVHHVTCEDRCPNCGRGFKIRGDIYEYPSGIFNYKDINTVWEERKI